MKRSTFFAILLICLSSRLFCSCDRFFSHGTFGIEEISLERLSKNILDLRIHHKQVFSDGYKEKMFVYDENEELDTSIVYLFINKDIILFNDSIPAKRNLWEEDKTRKYITFTKQCDDYSDLVFDSVFYQNISVDTVGLIVNFIVRGNDGSWFKTSIEE